MRKIVSCEFNMDTACVELRLEDGTLLSIDCTVVENEVANSMYQRSELDWLIYNDPLAYVVDHVDYLIAYAWHPASNARELVEYAKMREKKGSLFITLIKPDD